MNKKRMGLAAMAALLSVGGVQAVQPITPNDSKNTVQTQPKQVSETKKVVQSREIALDGTGGIQFDYYDRGKSPKEYGQYLQSRGLQKWNKRKK